MNGMEKINADFYVDKSKKLGQGNFGSVYKGYMLSQNQIIAVKHMTKQQLLKNPDYQRQITVMQDLSKLVHPHIMGYYGYQMTKQGLYCFIQFCGGGSLKQMVKRKISQIKTITLFKQLLQAMTYMNEQNKVHRDLKPDNILLDDNLELKIADFGLARDVEILMTKGAGTPLFAAPQVFNMEDYDEKCDVWSVGLILYEMLTGREFFEHVKTKMALKAEFEKFRRLERKVEYPKELHPQWTKLTEMMLVYNKTKRPSFKELFTHFQTIRTKMQTDLNTKYGFDQSNQTDLKASKMRTLQINPYASIHKSQKKDLQLKLQQEKSYAKITDAHKYLFFFRMKSDFLCKLIKAFTATPYTIMKNVYKYILMFLSVGYYISKVSQNVVQLKLKQVTTPDGIIQSSQITKTHLKQWQQLITQFKTRHAINIERFRHVLDKQIVDKIIKSYLVRQQQSKILHSYKNLVSWIQETSRGNFMKYKYYAEMYHQLINEEVVYCSEKQLQLMEHNDIKTYAYIRLAGKLDEFLPDACYKNEDFIRLKRQELENMDKASLIDYVMKFNAR